MNFWIPGEPKAQPRPTFNKFGHTYPAKRDKATTTWRMAIRNALNENLRFGFEDFDKTAFCLSLWFQFRRPKCHFRSGRYAHIMKDSAPELHIQKPDVDNLAKLIMDETEKHNKNLKDYENLIKDELKINRIYKDDSQISSLLSMKSWSADPGCLVSIVQIRTFEDLVRNTPFDVR